MKKKGYTLVEILGIIVVIAIIAVITIPLISGIIIKARKASYKDSVYGMIEAAKLYLAGNIDSIKEEDEVFFICDGKSCEYKGNKLYLKGPTPISGTIGITGKGETTLENVYNGKYYANKEEKEEVIISEEPSDILSRGELTDLIRDLQSEINDLKNQIGNKVEVGSLNNIKVKHDSDILTIHNKLGNDDISSFSNGTITNGLVELNNKIGENIYSKTEITNLLKNKADVTALNALKSDISGKSNTLLVKDFSITYTIGANDGTYTNGFLGGSIDISITNYKPIGIVGVDANQGCIVFNKTSINKNILKYYLRNTCPHEQSATGTISVLYVKA